VERTTEGLSSNSFTGKSDMRILVTGSAGHLGEALMRTLEHSDHEAIGLDIKSSPFTRRVGSIRERGFVKQCMQNVDVVLHTATLHKPHLVSHSRQDFVETNITGTLNLLEEAAAAGIDAEGAHARFWTIHHQRNHAFHPRRPARSAHRRPLRREAT
jgi:FlaA1/EpsC-like NDP-sugar epimerase